VGVQSFHPIARATNIEEKIDAENQQSRQDQQQPQQ
jgi:hypothetical protein